MYIFWVFFGFYIQSTDLQLEDVFTKNICRVSVRLCSFVCVHNFLFVCVCLCSFVFVYVRLCSFAFVYVRLRF